MSREKQLQLIHVADAKQLDDARCLFKEYAESLTFDLCFQNFEKELADLPGKYAPPAGCIILAFDGANDPADGHLNGLSESDPQRLAGCVAMRAIGEHVCEMKRLFVRPEFHGRGIGRALVDAIIRVAIERGYQYMRLDTVPSTMSTAIAMYRKIGFVEIDAYCENPVNGAIFMELDLQTTASK